MGREYVIIRPYGVGTSDKCPHCQFSVYFSSIAQTITAESGGDSVTVYSSQCPRCRRPIVMAEITAEGAPLYRMVHPFNVVRTVPKEVPKQVKEDFVEAAAVLPISEKASAALSRRCLQSLLNDKGYKGKDLNEQIEKALEDLPERIGANLDAIRNTGNFAAHPLKYQSTGLVVDVEPEEADWNLDVLEELFEYFYVQPKRAEEKRKKLEAKLKKLGKPPLKKP